MIATTSHYSTRVAVERAKAAEAAGSAMLMLMPPYHGALLKLRSQRIPCRKQTTIYGGHF